MSKLRTDSWAGALTEEQGWQLYYKARGLRWNEAAEWAVKEFGIDSPSRTAFYAWLGRMRAEESAHRLEQAATAAAEAAALKLKARAQETKDEQLKLAREKFEFDAAKKAMELAAEIKDVAGDDSLDDDEKIKMVRKALFG